MPMPGPVMAMLGGVSKIARTRLARSLIATTQRLTPGTQSLPPIHPPDRTPPRTRPRAPRDQTSSAGTGSSPLGGLLVELLDGMVPAPHDMSYWGTDLPVGPVTKTSTRS
jgi:hypothetical protein